MLTLGYHGHGTERVAVLFLFSAAVRFHCWRNCICQDRSELNNSLDDLRCECGSGSCKHTPRCTSEKETYTQTDSKGKPRTSSRGADNPSSRCAATLDKPATCTPWPFEILAPLPKVLEKLVSVDPPPVEEWDRGKTCGNVCSDYNDCGADCLW